MSLINKQAALKELEKRQKQLKAFNIEEFLFKEQLDFVRDPAPFKTAVCSRRSGKTISCAADLLETARLCEGVVCLYITLSRKNAKRIIWRELKRLNRLYGLQGEANESDLSMEFPNGSIIYCSGASDRGEIENFRGLPIKLCYIDESQSFPSYIQELIDDVIGPALLDHLGTLCLIGTPGPVPNGYFYDCSNSDGWAHHHWTFFQNPHMVKKSGESHEFLLQRVLKMRKLPVDHPSIQREYFGRWCLDSDSLVFHYTAEANDFKEVPKDNYTYILGIDIGFNDADALAVIGWSEKSKVTYLFEEVITKQQGIESLVEQIEDIRKRYDISKIVMDTGGLGKKIQESISSRYQIPVEPAEKVRKFEYIELLNADMRKGLFKARGSSRFAQDCNLVEYDLDKSTPDRMVVSKRYHSDINDAVLYAWRESYSYTHSEPKVGPKYGTRAWADAEQSRMFEAALDHFSQLSEENKGPWGDFNDS
jgi:hypothetical protein